MVHCFVTRSQIPCAFVNLIIKDPMNILRAAFAATGVLLAASALAQTPAGAPAGSTGLCKDGSYSNAASKRGACAGHKGVKDWYATDEKAPSTAAVAPAAPVAKTAAAPPPEVPAATKTASTAPAAGGGAGQVWVNSKSKVYHCQGDRYYGKTKAGEYMTESAAKAAGNHADHGKACA